MRLYRVFFTGYGDGYEEFDSLAAAEKAKAEWEAEYGEGEAFIQEKVLLGETLYLDRAVYPTPTQAKAGAVRLYRVIRSLPSNKKVVVTELTRHPPTEGYPKGNWDVLCQVDEQD